MSGKNLPYHLRVKKDIERRLFVEQLRLISKFYDLEQYSYVSMAGPFSEDFKLMSDRFNFKHFFSYEMDEDVYKRQKFNIPFNPIHYLHNNISDFSDNYPDIETLDLENIVIWLDYTDFKFEFFENFERLIGTLSKGSVIKITLLTHIAQVYSRNDIDVETMREERVKRLKDILGEKYFYSDIFTTDSMTAKGFPQIIFEVLNRIAYNSLIGGKTKLLPLSSYIYQDGMMMLTYTGILIDIDEEKIFLRKTGLDNWNYGLYSSFNPLLIDVPFLSLKEKYSLDACLPSPPSGELKYLQKKEFSSYEKFRKFYPTYAKII